MLSSLETSDSAKSLNLLDSEVVAVEESPVFSDCPCWSFDLSSVPLDQVYSILEVLSDGLF